jgi:NADH-quinone oxidoreductase subunit G
VVAISMFDDASTALADIVLPAETHAEKEGTVTHPDGRLQRLRPNVPQPGQVRPGWIVLRDLAAELGLSLDLPDQPSVLAAMADDVPIYAGLTNEEIGGTGIRWQERDQARTWTPSSEVGPSAAAPADGPPGPGLILGTYPDLWASEVTERNPALRFLMPAQRLELAAEDAKELELESGAPVTVSVNGTSVEARVAIRERMRPGAAFLIEGTKEGNANLLANGAPQRISIAKRNAEETAD